ncbi:MAG TPA: hypothetical protein VF841_16445 [Anaeromyxobacter sp.]
MNRSTRRMLTSLAVCAALAAAPAAALAWAAGTHAYVAKRTYRMSGLVDDAELCRRVLGANGPDLFNSIWDDEAQALALVLHTRDPRPNLAPYAAASGDAQRALGFGFASHNNGWGTDATAHVAGRTFGQDEGYVIAKAAVVGALLAPTLGDALGLPPDVARALATDVSHNFVEYGVDLLLAQADPQLGWTLYGSAGCYLGTADDDFLVKALVPWMAPALPPGATRSAEQWVRLAEAPFVRGLAANGYVLTLPFDVAKATLAHQLAVEGRSYLAWRYAGVPGFDPPPPVELLEQLASAGLDVAVAVCAPDVMGELEATTGWVNGRMSSNAISP